MAARPRQSELDATRPLLTQLDWSGSPSCPPELLERAVKEELCLPKFLPWSTSGSRSRSHTACAPALRSTSYSTRCSRSWTQ